MPVYYLLDRLNVDGESLPAFSTQGLYQLSEKSRAELIDRGLIRQIKAPPLSVFDSLAEYDTILEEIGIQDLGDLAGWNPNELPVDLIKYQQQSLKFLDPGRPATIPPDDCCG